MANRQLSLREKTKSALERIGQIEDNYDSLMDALQKELGNMQKTLANVTETLDAVKSSIGKDVVEAIIEDTRNQKKTEEATKAKDEIAKLVEQKVLVPAETVGEDSFIIGHDIDGEGNTIHPGFGHVHFRQVDAKFQEKVKGVSAGTSIPTGPEGSKSAFVIDQIYTFVPPKPPEVKEEAPPAEVVPAAETNGMEMSAVLHPAKGQLQ
jgi:hypothetical protein